MEGEEIATNPAGSTRREYPVPVVSLKATMVSAGIASAVYTFVAYPLDTLKTRLQSFRDFRTTGGFRGLYQGVSPALFGGILSSAAFFGMYNRALDYQKLINPSFSDIYRILAAAISVAGSCVVRVPFEVLKQRLQVSIQPISQKDMLFRMYRNRGVPVFFQGLWHMAIREVVFIVVQFPVWEKLMFRVVEPGKLLTLPQAAFCGGASSAVAAVVTTPIDVAKTRVMLTDRPERLLKAMMKIYKDRGLGGYLSGIVPRTVFVSIGGATYFVVYVQMKSVLRDKF